MARYITRVELHGARDEEYDLLHAAMEAEGFERTITASDGTTYHLPAAEYYLQTQLERTQVLDAAKRAAGKTKRAFGVIVTEAPVSSWSGLTPVGN